MLPHGIVKATSTGVRRSVVVPSPNCPCARRDVEQFLETWVRDAVLFTDLGEHGHDAQPDRCVEHFIDIQVNHDLLAPTRGWTDCATTEPRRSMSEVATHKNSMA